MSQDDTKRIEDFITDLNQAELSYLNRLIVERLKLMSQAKSTREMAKYNIGELVEFESADGDTIAGRIIKLNKKTVSILTSGNHQWNVSPVFVRSVETG